MRKHRETWGREFRSRWGRTRTAISFTVVAALLAGLGLGTMPAQADDEETRPPDAIASGEPTWTITPTTSYDPSMAPTEDSTDEPSSSESPSVEPTTAPTPSELPSTDPTKEPTADPSKADSPEPTASSPPPGETFAIAPMSIMPMSVPSPASGGAVVNVKVGGTRTGANSVGSLAGVKLGLYTAATGGTLRYECESDTQGDCSFEVPSEGIGSSYYVRQISAPSGWYTNGHLALNPGTSAGNTASTTYTFATPRLESGQTYTSGDDFMQSQSGVTNSSGLWQNSLGNPTIPTKCGLKVALIFDFSASVGSTNLESLKVAARSFVTALENTPSSVALYTFATTAPATADDTLALTDVSTKAGADAVRQSITSLQLPNNGWTNWDKGLWQVANSEAKYDIAVMITDGNPTTYGSSTSGQTIHTSFLNVEAGIASANAIKAKGTKVIAFGVGDAVGSDAAGLNLRAISGETANEDYFQTGTYQAAADKLTELAIGECLGKLTVTKRVVPADAPDGSIAGAQLAEGWTFGATASEGIDLSVADGTTGPDGSVSFAPDFRGATVDGTMTVTESPEGEQEAYALQQVDGANAACMDALANEPIAVTNSGDLGFTVPVAQDGAITCTVYNRAPSDDALVTLHKNWVIDGGDEIADGLQPDGMVATGSIDGEDVSWGMEQSHKLNSEITINEVTDLSDHPLCSITSSRITEANGSSVDFPLGTSQTLTASENHFTITNTVECLASLTLVKEVNNNHGGTDRPGDWTLTADPNTSGVDFLTGASPVTGTVTPGEAYSLSESGPTGYALKSLTCVDTKSGSDFSGFDSDTGEVVLQASDDVTCTFVNEDIAPTLSLTKIVAGTDADADWVDKWTLTATGEGVALSGNGSVPSTEVKANTPITLDEAPVEGFDASSFEAGAWTCIGGVYADGTINLGPGQDASCTITNTHTPMLEIDKSLTGVTAGPHGTWFVDYKVTVTNPGYKTVSYELKDELDFHASLTVNSASSSANPDWDGAESTLIEEGELAPGVSREVTVRVNVSVPVDAPEQALECEVPPAAGQGTYNSATVTWDGRSVSDDACGNIPTPGLIISKEVGPTSQLPSGQWVTSYEITVTNEATDPTRYDLTDTLKFGAGITVESASWTRSVPADPALNGTWIDPVGNPTLTLVEGEPITAGTTHTYEVEVISDIAAGGGIQRVCGSGEDGAGGFLNLAEIVFPGGTADDEACLDLPDPSFSIDKTAVEAVEEPLGSWTVTYTVVVENTSPVPGIYSLTDTLGYGDPIVVTDARWSHGQDSGSWELPDLTTTLATDVPLAAGAQHSYDVEVFSDVPPSVIGSEVGICSEAPGAESGGFLNSATVTWETSDARSREINSMTDQDCLEPFVSYGSLTVTKELAGLTDGLLDEGAAFDVSWSCTTPTGEVLSGDAEVTAGAGTVLSEEIPLGSTCSVEEEAPSADLLAETYFWLDPSYDAESVDLTLEAPTGLIGITNTIGQDDPQPTPDPTPDPTPTPDKPKPGLPHTGV